MRLSLHFLTCLTSVQRKLVDLMGNRLSGLWFCLVVFCLFCCWCFGFACVIIPHHHDVFPFLPTMTWAHRPHGVRTVQKSSTVSLHLAVESLATRPLRNAAPCNGCMQPTELPIGFAAPPSLGITSFETVSILPNFTCEIISPQAGYRRKLLPMNWRKVALALRGLPHLRSRKISQY